MHMLALVLALRSQKTLAIVTLVALIVWAVGLPFFIHRAQAVQLGEVKDTLSDSDISAPANHLIEFITPNGLVANGMTITVTFPALFNLTGLTEDDVDILDDGVQLTTAATCPGTNFGASFSGQVLTLTNCATGGVTVASSSKISIFIGTSASSSGTGANQIDNPNASNDYEIDIAGTFPDSGSTRVFIIDDVTVTAEVDTTLDFVIAPVGSGQSINGDAVNTFTASFATSMPFGVVSPGVGGRKTLGQQLNVTTNAANGFTVTVQADQTLTSASTATIDLFDNGTATPTPVAWTSPAGDLGVPDTYGHWGLTSEDADLNGDEFGSALYVGNFVATPRVVFHHDEPADGNTANIGTTRVGYKIEIDELQEAANDYTATLTYVCTPSF